MTELDFPRFAPPGHDPSLLSNVANLADTTLSCHMPTRLASSLVVPACAAIARRQLLVMCYMLVSVSFVSLYLLHLPVVSYLGSPPVQAISPLSFSQVLHFFFTP